MKNAEEMKLLMSFNPKERQFVIDAVKYIEKALDQHCYNYDELFDKDFLMIKIEDIIFTVFAYQIVDGEKCVISWKTPTKKHSAFQEVPKELAYKNWGQIYRTLSADSYKEWDFIDYLKVLKKFLELKGFKVSSVYPFYTDKIRIAW